MDRKESQNSGWGGGKGVSYLSLSVRIFLRMGIEGVIGKKGRRRGSKRICLVVSVLVVAVTGKGGRDGVISGVRDQQNAA